MIPLVRKEKIKKLLLEYKSVTVTDLSEKYNVSEETIRRDLNLLEEEGIAKRTHGGAVLAESVISRVSTSDLKQIFVESKRTIANYVVPHIKPRDCIFIDSSTTSFYVGELLANIPVTVVTNSLETLAQLSKYEQIDLIAIGGNLSKNRKCFVGSSAQLMLKNYYFDYTFMSCRTLSLDEGATDSNIEEAEIKRIVASRSRETWLLADHTKFNKLSFAKILPLTSFNCLVTDKPLDDQWRDYLVAHGIRSNMIEEKQTDE